MTSTQSSTKAAATAVATSPAAALWRIVASEYESEVTAYRAVAAEYEVAMREHDRISETFEERLAAFKPFQPISLHYGGDAITLVYAKLASARVKANRERHPDAANLTHKEQMETYAEAGRVLSEYAALQDEMADAVEGVWGDAEKRHDAAVDRLSAARDKLIHTPAHDAAALIYKMAVLEAYLTECESEDRDRAIAIFNDARRLFDAA